MRLEDLENSGESRRGLAEEIDLLRLEANTWALLQAILPCVYRPDITARMINAKQSA